MENQEKSNDQNAKDKRNKYLDDIYQQIKYEIDDFQKNKELELIELLKKFFNEKIKNSKSNNYISENKNMNPI